MPQGEDPTGAECRTEILALVPVLLEEPLEVDLLNTSKYLRRIKSEGHLFHHSRESHPNQHFMRGAKGNHEKNELLGAGPL